MSEPSGDLGPMTRLEALMASTDVPGLEKLNQLVCAEYLRRWLGALTWTELGKLKADVEARLRVLDGRAPEPPLDLKGLLGP